MAIVALEALNFGLNRLADAAEKIGERLYLLTHDKSAYAYELDQNKGKRISIVEADTFDSKAIEQSIAKIPDVRCLLTTTDTWSLIGLEVAERLGFPSKNSEAIRLVRDKYKLRNHLFNHGLSSGNSMCIDPKDSIDINFDKVRFPVIIKDAAGTGSQNVWLAKDQAGLSDILTQAKYAQLKGLLTIEPYFNGTLYSSEAISWEGETKILAISSRILSQEPDFMELAISTPVNFPTREMKQIENWITKVLDGIGYADGFSHTEFIITKQGFEVVEVNPRLGGVQIGEALCRIYDQNIYQAYVDVSLGHRPNLLDFELSPQKGIAQIFVYANRRGRFEGMEGLDRLSEHPGHPVFYPTLIKGKEIEHLKDQRACVGILMVEGPNSEVAMQNAFAASSKIRTLLTQ